MSICVFEHPFLSGLFKDEAVDKLFSAAFDVQEMIRFEVALAKAQAELGLIPEAAALAIAETASSFRADMAKLNQATARDGVVIPELVKQLRAHVGETYAHYVHFGATSQDVIDTSLMLRLKTFTQIAQQKLAQLLQQFDALDKAHGKRGLSAYTRMQAALPVTVHDRMVSWIEPLKRAQYRLDHLRFPLQLGGAVGTLQGFGDQAAALRERLSLLLELVDLPQWQSTRDIIADIAHAFVTLSGSLGKFGQDIAMMAQSVEEIALSGGGASSAMPHKQNPVNAEILVSLARFNAVQISAIQQSMVHEQERSGAAWSLEWMVLPQICASLAAALNIGIRLTDQIQSLGKDL
ncbi:3-carboxy-cis,cis-muconate cycloisomerase [Paenochrobactrum pullorum]|uniref:3-carboxy-cis,cis-muconate cycloisomerase n=1 Tax=Paenochrobactrum pullorum TaxID=1324351 RepID=UPI0035BC0968